MFHSKEAVLATILSFAIGIIVGCTALNIAVEVEVNITEEEEAKKEAEKNHQSSQKKEE